MVAKSQTWLRRRVDWRGFPKPFVKADIASVQAAWDSSRAVIVLQLVGFAVQGELTLFGSISLAPNEAAEIRIFC